MIKRRKNRTVYRRVGYMIQSNTEAKERRKRKPGRGKDSSREKVRKYKKVKAGHLKTSGGESNALDLKLAPSPDTTSSDTC